MQGMAFGAGSEVAHRAIGGLMGGSGGHGAQPVQQQQDQAGYNQGQYGAQEPCMSESTNFMKCLQSNYTDIGVCQNYSDLFKSCKSSYMA